jgi:hypothetical protein
MSLHDKDILQIYGVIIISWNWLRLDSMSSSIELFTTLKAKLTSLAWLEIHENKGSPARSTFYLFEKESMQ